MAHSFFGRPFRKTSAFRHVYTYRHIPMRRRKIFLVPSHVHCPSLRPIRPAVRHVRRLSVIQHHPNRPLGSHYEYERPMIAKDKNKRLGKLMISDAVELLKLVKSIHLDRDHCLSKRPEACYIRPNITFLQEGVATMPMGVDVKGRINAPLSLASHLQTILVGCYARHEYFLRPEGWISSTTGLLEPCKFAG